MSNSDNEDETPTQIDRQSIFDSDDSHSISSDETQNVSYSNNDISLNNNDISLNLYQIYSEDGKTYLPYNKILENCINIKKLLNENELDLEQIDGMTEFLEVDYIKDIDTSNNIMTVSNVFTFNIPDLMLQDTFRTFINCLTSNDTTYYPITIEHGLSQFMDSLDLQVNPSQYLSTRLLQNFLHEIDIENESKVVYTLETDDNTILNNIVKKINDIQLLKSIIDKLNGSSSEKFSSEEQIFIQENGTDDFNRENQQYFFMYKQCKNFTDLFNFIGIYLCKIQDTNQQDKQELIQKCIDYAASYIVLLNLFPNLISFMTNKIVFDDIINSFPDFLNSINNIQNILYDSLNSELSDEDIWSSFYNRENNNSQEKRQNRIDSVESAKSINRVFSVLSGRIIPPNRTGVLVGRNLFGRGLKEEMGGGSCEIINYRNPLLSVKFLFEWEHDFGDTTKRAIGAAMGYNYITFYNKNDIFEIIQQNWNTIMTGYGGELIKVNASDNIDKDIYTKFQNVTTHNESTYVSTIINALLDNCAFIVDDFFYIPVMEFKFVSDGTNPDSNGIPQDTRNFFANVFKYYNNQRMFIKNEKTENEKPNYFHLFVTSDNTPTNEATDTDLGYYMKDMNIEDIVVALGTKRKSLYEYWNTIKVEPDIVLQIFNSEQNNGTKTEILSNLTTYMIQKHIKTPAKLIDPITIGGFDCSGGSITQNDVSLNNAKIQELLNLASIYGINQLSNFWINEKKTFVQEVEIVCDNKNKKTNTLKFKYFDYDNKENVFEWCVGDTTISSITGALINLLNFCKNDNIKISGGALNKSTYNNLMNYTSNDSLKRIYEIAFIILENSTKEKEKKVQEEKSNYEGFIQFKDFMTIISYLKSCGDEYQRLTCEFFNYVVSGEKDKIDYLLEYLPTDKQNILKNICSQSGGIFGFDKFFDSLLGKRQLQQQEYSNSKRPRPDDLPEEMETNSDVTPEEMETNSDVTPEEMETNSDVTPEEMETSSDGPDKEMETNSDVTPEEMETSSDVTPEEMETSSIVLPQVNVTCLQNVYNNIFFLTQDRVLVGESLAKNTPLFSFLQSPNDAFYSNKKEADDFYANSFELKKLKYSNTSSGVLSNRKSLLTTETKPNYEYIINNNNEKIQQLSIALSLKLDMSSNYTNKVETEDNSQNEKIIKEQQNEMRILTKILLALEYYNINTNTNKNINLKELYCKCIDCEIWKAVSMTINNDLLNDLRLKNSFTVIQNTKKLESLINNMVDEPEVVDKLIQSYELASELLYNKIKNYSDIVDSSNVEISVLGKIFQEFNEDTFKDDVKKFYSVLLSYITEQKGKLRERIIGEIQNKINFEIEKMSRRPPRNVRESFYDAPIESDIQKLEELTEQIDDLADEQKKIEADLLIASTSSSSNSNNQPATPPREQEQGQNPETTKIISLYKRIKQTINSSVKRLNTKMNKTNQLLQTYIKERQNLEIKIASKTKRIGIETYKNFISYFTSSNRSPTGGNNRSTRINRAKKIHKRTMRKSTLIKNKKRKTIKHKKIRKHKKTRKP
jgi:hypothetical protein